jgi:cytochrome c553
VKIRLFLNVIGVTLVVVSVEAPSLAAEGIETKVEICSSCHGSTGLPNDPSIPILWGQLGAYLEKQLHDYKYGDRDNQIMASIAESLKKDDIPQIAAFFADKRWPLHASNDVVKSPPDAISICQGCHQENLLGGPSPIGVAPRLAGQSRGYLSDTMRAFAKGERSNSADMSALMKTLSAEEREAIAAYLSAL